jgi:hypothetical protein
VQRGRKELDQGAAHHEREAPQTNNLHFLKHKPFQTFNFPGKNILKEELIQ